MVIFRPMFHVGWWHAICGVTKSSCSLVNCLNGPPDAVSISRLTSRFSPAQRHWNMAFCSLSTGIISPPPFRFACSTNSCAQTMLSLLARATRLPASSAAISGSVPAKPLTAFTTVSAAAYRAATAAASFPAYSSTPLGSSSFIESAAASSSMHISSGINSFACSSARRAFLPAHIAHTSNSSLCERTTSSVCVPMDPVLPSTAIFFMGILYSGNRERSVNYRGAK